MSIKVVHHADLGKTSTVINGKYEVNLQTPAGLDSFDNGVSRIQSWELQDYTEGQDKYKVKQLLFTEPFDIFDKEKYDANFDLLQSRVNATFAEHPDVYNIKTQWAGNGGPNLYRQQDGKLGFLVTETHDGPSALTWLCLKMTQGSTPLFIDKTGAPDDQFYSSAWRSGVNDITYMQLVDGASAVFDFIVPTPLERVYIPCTISAQLARPILDIDFTLEDDSVLSKKLTAVGLTYAGYDVIPTGKRIKRVKITYRKSSQVPGLKVAQLKLSPEGKLIDSSIAGTETWPSVIAVSYIYIYGDIEGRKFIDKDFIDITSLFTLTSGTTSNTAPITGAVDNDPATAWTIPNTSASILFTAKINDPLKPVHVNRIEMDLESSDGLATAVNVRRLTVTLANPAISTGLLYSAYNQKGATKDYLPDDAGIQANGGKLTLVATMDTYLASPPEESTSVINVTLTKASVPAIGAVTPTSTYVRAIRIFGQP